MDAMGLGKVSCIDTCRFAHFRGIKKAYLGHSKVSLVQRCPYPSTVHLTMYSSLLFS